MKTGIHPEDYRLVVFKDVSNDYSFITKSTVDTKETIKWEDGKEYPLFKLEISHKSHPFFTGKMKFVDTAGRVDKFFAKYGKKKTQPVSAATKKEEPKPLDANIENKEVKTE